MGLSRAGKYTTKLGAEQEGASDVIAITMLDTASVVPTTSLTQAETPLLVALGLQCNLGCHN
eukprot:1104669-Amphidinium_carterae.1